MKLRGREEPDRAHGDIEDVHDRLGETLDRLDPLRKLPRYSAQRIYQRVALKRISASLLQGLLRREAPATPIVAPGTLLSALRDYLGHRGREIGNGCSEAFGALVRQMAAPLQLGDALS